MMWYTRWIYLLLNGFLLLATVQAQDDDWIDPTDMLNYEAASGKMKSSKVDIRELDNEVPSSVDGKIACDREKKELEMKQAALLQEIDSFQKKENTRSRESSSIALFKRYLNKILAETGKLGLPDEYNNRVHYDAEIILTKQTLSDINKFLTGEDWKPGALDDSLTDILINFKHHDIEAWKWRFEDYVGIDPFSLCLVLLSLLFLVFIVATELYARIGWFTQLKRLFIISFIISVGWNWMYLYKVEFAQRQAEVAKMDNIDTKCSEKMDWAEWIARMWSIKDDPCQEYYKALIVSPALMVPPTKALALTFTHFVTEPLKHVGQGIGEFIKALLKELPGIYHVPVLIVLTVIVLSFCYGAAKTLPQLYTMRRLHGPEREDDRRRELDRRLQGPEREDDRRRELDNRRINYFENLPLDDGRGDADRFGRHYDRDDRVAVRARERGPQGRQGNSSAVLQIPFHQSPVGGRPSQFVTEWKKVTTDKNIPHGALEHQGNLDKALGESGVHADAVDGEDLPESRDLPSAMLETEKAARAELNRSSEPCSKNDEDSKETKKKEEQNPCIQKEILAKITVETVTSSASAAPSPPT